MVDLNKISEQYNEDYYKKYYPPNKDAPEVKKYEEYKKKYPRLFKYYTRSGIYAPRGWSNLIDDLCKELEDILKKEDDDNVYVAQIKEKFGGLRFYMASTIEGMYEIIDKYCKMSYSICETCGKPGVLREGRWIQTLCDSCSEGRKKLEKLEKWW